MSDSRVTSLLSDGLRVIEVEERRVGPRRVLITVVGDVDHSTHALLRSAMTRTWEGRPIAVAVDLRQVTFLNAAGLRTLLLTSGTARARGVPLVLQAAPGQVTRLLTMVGFSEQMLSPSDVQAVLATASRVSRPVLRLVPPTDVAEDPTTPAAAAPRAGQAVHGALHLVQALGAERVAEDQVVVEHRLDPSPPIVGRGGAAAGGMAAEPGTTSRSRAGDLRISEGAGAVRSARGPVVDWRAALRRTLLSRELVDRATGMLMQRDSITADQALDVLNDASRNRNQSIVVVAEELTGTQRP